MNAPLPLGEAELQARHRAGLLAGLGAYGMWGLLPLYFKLIHGALPMEVVAHRIVWSVAFLAIVLAGYRLYPALRDSLRQPRIVAALAISALLIAANWLVYVWAVDTRHVVAASLGYFLNPLVNVLLGTLVLKERLQRGQFIAVLLAGVGVAILAAGEIQTLWISLSLAISFALYGLVRKLTPVPALGGSRGGDAAAGPARARGAGLGRAGRQPRLRPRRRDHGAAGRPGCRHIRAAHPLRKCCARAAAGDPRPHAIYRADIAVPERRAAAGRDALARALGQLPADLGGARAVRLG
ncbi:EamA family transporter RarD [Sphingobium lignivorans]|uniref:Membrane protein n=1 Tax=Sphingobium lignivorans TaxID=2735886 RepID=A0ABR6NBF6_9SPHN|nr:putative membrane protein [Sphingobium lignivorans]